MGQNSSLQYGTNWAGNVAYRAAAQTQVNSVDQISELVARADRVKVLGGRHTFNDVADTAGTQIRLDGLSWPIEVDAASATVRVPPAMTHAVLAEALHAQGWALANLASLPHICAAGAVATGTHGSGDQVPNLSGSVVAIELVDGTGELRTIGRQDPEFAGVGVHLGALGVITAVTLAVEPTYEVSQQVFLDLPYELWGSHFDEITSLGYSVSVFTRWLGPDADQLWVKSRAGQQVPDQVFGAIRADRTMHPIRDVNPENVTTQLGEPGPWHQRLPHFRPEFEPASGAEIQSEFFVKRPDAPAAIEAIRSIGEQIAPALLISEIRTMAADQLWVSPAYDTDGVGSVGFHFTWRDDQAVVDAHLPYVEQALAQFVPRPHWGKVFKAGPKPIELYPQGARFVELAQRLDPRGVFRNAYLDRNLY